MADNQFMQQFGVPGQQPPQPHGNEPKFGAPPGPELNVRTLGSDTRSIGRGDAAPMPESVLPPTGATDPMFKPETQVDPSFTPPEGGEEMGSGKGKKLWLWIAVGIAVVAVAVIGYFVYPLIFGGGTAEPTPPPPTPPVAPPPPAPEVRAHQSFFVDANTPKSEALLTNVSRDTVVITLSSLAAQSAGTVQEVAILDQNRSQVQSSVFLKEFVTDVAASQMAPWFEDDFTAFVYYDANGAWPGYIFKIKAGVNLDEVKTNASVVEGGDLSRFYLSAPGTFSAFKSGSLSGKATRYAVGSQPGASFNYGVMGDYLILSTSFNGLKAAVPMLGL